MSRKLKNFSINNIDGIIDYLNEYKSELQDKANEFCLELAQVGVDVAYANSGEWHDFILFKKEQEDDKVILIGMDRQKVIKVWYTDIEKTNMREYEISPLLLAEFGSGWYANDKHGVEGVGQGTMPDSYGHAFDPNGWWWYDKSGNKHHSKGEKPSYPMYAATIGMVLEIDRIARKVFGK